MPHKNPEDKKRYFKKYYQERGKHLHKLKYQKIRSNPEEIKKFNARIRKARLKREYGLTEEGLVEFLNKQDNRCAICLIQFDNNIWERKPRIDHNHSTGNIREALCNNCNSGLGMMKENITSLQRMIDYINKHNK